MVRPIDYCFVYLVLYLWALADVGFAESKAIAHHGEAHRAECKNHQEPNGNWESFGIRQEVFSQYGSVKQVTVLPVAAGKSAAAAFVIMHTVTRLQRTCTTKRCEVRGKVELC